MKVLKFGGSSVAKPENIVKIKNIISKYNDPIILVVSAFGGVTDLLLQAGSLASAQDQKYKEILHTLEERHLATVKELIPVTTQSKVLSKVKSEFNVLETLLEGAYFIGEITPKLSDKIVSYGELLSSYIISEYLINEKLDAVFKDSRELIITHKLNGKNVVNFTKTNANCEEFFNSSKKTGFSLPRIYSHIGRRHIYYVRPWWFRLYRCYLCCCGRCRYFGNMDRCEWYVYS